MNAKSLLVAPSCGAILAGCATTPPERIDPVLCDQPKCEITVQLDARGTVSVDKPLLRVTAHNMRLVWVLPAGSEFNLHLGDGVFLKAADSDQFDEFYPTNDASAGPPSDPHKGKLYHWKNKNTVKGTHDYKIQFHDGTGALRFLDPTIMNDG